MCSHSILYKDFCEGCESKKCKIAVVRAHAHAREMRKTEENSYPCGMLCSMKADEFELCALSSEDFAHQLAEDTKNRHFPTREVVVNAI